MHNHCVLIIIIKFIGEFARDSLIDCNSLFVEIIEDSVGGGWSPIFASIFPNAKPHFDLNI